MSPFNKVLGVKTRRLGKFSSLSAQSYTFRVTKYCAPTSVQSFFYRSSGGAEVDLLLAWPSGELWAIEIKRSLSPKVERGFHSACDDLKPSRKLVVYPGSEAFPLGNDVQAVPLEKLCAELASKATV